jgi:hypothetical protein
MCPRAYCYKYIEGKKEPSSASLIGGQVTHKVLEFMANMKAIDFTEELVTSQFKRIFKDQWEQSTAEGRDGLTEESVLAEISPLIPSLHYYCKTEVPRLKLMGQELQISKEVPISRLVSSSRGKVAVEPLGHITFAGFVDFVNYTGESSIQPMERILPSLTDVGFTSKLEVGDFKTGALQDMSFFAILMLLILPKCEWIISLLLK